MFVTCPIRNAFRMSRLTVGITTNAPRITPWAVCLLIGSFVPIPSVTPVTCDAAAVVVQCPALPRELKLGPSTLAGVGRARKTEKSLSVRVMDRLQQAEAHESNTHLRQDIRQAWICVSFASKGRPEPFLESSYACYGVHPSKVWERILDERHARLGAEYHEWYTSDDVLRPDVPKIPHNTADADTHAANGASHDDWDIAGLVPIPERKLV